MHVCECVYCPTQADNFKENVVSVVQIGWNRTPQGGRTRYLCDMRVLPSPQRTPTRSFRSRDDSAPGAPDTDTLRERGQQVRRGQPVRRGQAEVKQRAEVNQCAEVRLRSTGQHRSCITEVHPCKQVMQRKRHVTISYPPSRPIFSCKAQLGPKGISKDSFTCVSSVLVGAASEETHLLVTQQEQPLVWARAHHNTCVVLLRWTGVISHGKATQLLAGC